MKERTNHYRGRYSEESLLTIDGSRGSSHIKDCSSFTDSSIHTYLQNTVIFSHCVATLLQTNEGVWRGREWAAVGERERGVEGEGER